MAAMTEVTEGEARLRKLRMRSWRRGTKEMDLILGPWADAHLAGLAPAALDIYEALLEENDQDLYYWVAGDTSAVAGPPPQRISGLLAEIATHARARLRPAV
jgi:antitoxin CptB